jgi:hypothetical protein
LIISNHSFLPSTLVCVLVNLLTPLQFPHIKNAVVHNKFVASNYNTHSSQATLPSPVHLNVI